MKKSGRNKKIKRLILAGIAGGIFVTQPVCAQNTDGQESRQNTIISANVAHYIEAPSYIMSIPSATNFGELGTEYDQIQNYEIDIDVKDKTGTLIVSAPEAGMLNFGTHTLKFENDFGTQEIALSDLKEEEKWKKSLSGTLTIRADEIKKAAPGNYKGTTIFTITYINKKSDTDNKSDGNKGNNNGNQNAADGISNTLKKNTIGSNTLGVSKLGNGSLGSSKLGNSSGSLTSANKTAGNLTTPGVKTGDSEIYKVWLGAIMLSVVCMVAVCQKKKKQKKIWESRG